MLFLTLYIVIVLANSVDPDQMGLHYLPKSSLQRVNFFLHETLCCGHSIEASWQETSNKHQQMFRN